MEIIVGKLCGFCSGVSYAINKATKLLENSNENTYCLGEIIHNEKVVSKLENMGMITVNNTTEITDYAKVIFRAHGESKQIYEIANQKHLQIIDLTCGKVRIIHNKVAKESNDSFIIIIGKKNHPETIGTVGYAINASYIIENETDFTGLVQAFNNSNLKKVYVICQTTFNDSLFAIYVKKIKNILNNSEIIIDKTICNATENRQKEVFTIAKNVDKMLIIGGKNSSNTKQLANIAQINCQKVYLVQDLNDIKLLDFNNNDKIGIAAGTSTPKETIAEIINYLKQL